MKMTKNSMAGWIILAIGALTLGYDYFGATNGGVAPAEQHASPAPKVARPNTVMIIPGDREGLDPEVQYRAIDNADVILIQLCDSSKEQCAVRLEDLKAFRAAYAGKLIQFGQIDTAKHIVFAAQRRAQFEAAAAEAVKSPPASPAPATPAPTVTPDLKGTLLDKQEMTEIPGVFEPRGYFDTCKAKSPESVTYLLKNGGPDLTEGIICSAAELQEFISKNADGLQPNASPDPSKSWPTFSSQPSYDRALLAERLDAQTKPSMATVSVKQAGKTVSSGSAFIVGVDKAGRCEAVTAHHVADDKRKELEVVLANGQTYPATIALEKETRELTILKVGGAGGVENPSQNCKPIKIADGAVKDGQQVFMATIPLPVHFNPLAERWTRPASDNIGTITANNKPFSPQPHLISSYLVGQAMLVDDIQGYGGDSGSALVNLNAEVVGLNFVTQERGSITFAVPAEFIREALDELHQKESAKP